MFQFILAMYIASANGLYVPTSIQVAAWVILGLQFCSSFTKKHL